MKPIKVLNLYAGIGGNRKLWKNVEVTAVEINPKIGEIYQNFFPNDNVIIGDAHEFLLQHYNKFDLIWSSIPCQTHSSFRQNICVRFRDTKPVYPDMKLYEEILFLQYNCNSLWVVENVKPYYEPLIKPNKILQRHLFWTNFYISDYKIDHDLIRELQIPQLQTMYGIDLSQYKIPNKRQILRNCVHPKLGKHIFNCAFNTQSLEDFF